MLGMSSELATWCNGPGGRLKHVISEAWELSRQIAVSETAILRCEKNAGKFDFTRQTLGQAEVTLPAARILLEGASCE